MFNKFDAKIQEKVKCLLVAWGWQKWWYSYPQTLYSLIKIRFSALTSFMKIATFAKPENFRFGYFFDSFLYFLGETFYCNRSQDIRAWRKRKKDHYHQNNFIKLQTGL